MKINGNVANKQSQFPVNPSCIKKNGINVKYVYTIFA